MDEQAEGIEKKAAPPPPSVPEATEKPATEQQDATHHTKIKLARHAFTIHDPHHAKGLRQGTAQVFKFSFALILVIAILSALFASFKKWREYQQRQTYLETIEKNLKGVDAMIATEAGYAKCKLAEEGMHLAEDAMLNDKRNIDKWQAVKEKFLQIINTESNPDFGSDFIVPNAMIDLAFIPKGTFMMGRQDNEQGGPEEQPRRKILIYKDFWIGRTEVTNAQMRVFFPNYTCKQWHMIVLDSASQPACDVDWHQADRFCSLLTELERTARRLPPGYVYRLPTEAEWEYACRGGTETTYYWGDTFGEEGAEFANSLDKRAAEFAKVQYAEEEQHMPNSDKYLVSAPVGRFKPNAFGLFDMSGNVSEWCYDWYNPNAYSQLPAKSPVQLEPIAVPFERMGEFDRRYTIQATCRVLRSGSWGNLPSQLRSAHRDYVEPQQKYHGIGFRIVLGPAIKPATPPVKQEPPQPIK